MAKNELRSLYRKMLEDFDGNVEVAKFVENRLAAIDGMSEADAREELKLLRGKGRPGFVLTTGMRNGG